MSLTSLAEDPYLGASDGRVVLVSKDSDGHAFAVQQPYSPAQIHVGKGKNTQVQRAGRRQDAAEKTGKRRLCAVR